MTNTITNLVDKFPSSISSLNLQKSLQIKREGSPHKRSLCPVRPATKRKAPVKQEPSTSQRHFHSYSGVYNIKTCADRSLINKSLKDIETLTESRFTFQNPELTEMLIKHLETLTPLMDIERLMVHINKVGNLIFHPLKFIFFGYDGAIEVFHTRFGNRSLHFAVFDFNT